MMTMHAQFSSQTPVAAAMSRLDDVSASPPPSVTASQSHVRRRRGPVGWLAIVATIAFAGFLGMFSLDEPVLSIGFVMHNIPALVIVVGAVLGWWRSWAGAAWLAAAAIAGLAFFHTWHHWSWPLVINTPPFILAALFAIDALRRR